MRKTTIAVTEKNWKDLGKIRIDLGLRTYDDVITLLIGNIIEVWNAKKNNKNR